MRFERFLSTQTANECWLWLGAVSKGYGNFSIKAEGFQAHRVSFHLYKGSLVPGLQIDHLCRVKTCVNPDHLEQVSPRENTLRGTGITARLAKKETCPRGHLYELRKRKDGARICAQCQAAGEKAYRDRNKKGAWRCPACHCGFKTRRAMKIHSTVSHFKLKGPIAI